ncbi:hypothetical protein CLV48_11545 [Cecembia rubra]|uniref:Uncharacterized protein n=2 Tax=Cecembia rubra TaxID=1485585 RepID=A0A2P8DTE8_9BACT|nr:hypothetical protein CLV48_11545 [Cecembia rubra]
MIYLRPVLGFSITGRLLKSLITFKLITPNFMKMKYFLSTGILLTLLWGCNIGSESGKIDEPGFFPVKEYVEVHASKLEGKTLYKEVTINGETEKTEGPVTVDELMKELDFFIKADINSPALADSYETERSRRYLIHTLKEGAKGKVKKIVVQYYDEDVKEISFHMKTENPFYESETRGVLLWHASMWVIHQYNIEHYQKVIFMKPNRMFIKGDIW